MASLWFTRLKVGLLGLALLMATACGSTVGGGSATPTATTTPAPTSTATPSCATLDPGATNAATIANFTDVHFPTGAVIKTTATTGDGAGKFTITEYDLCYTGTLDQVNGPFSGHSSVFAYLLGGGWGSGSPSLFPYNAELQTACTTGANCFISGADIEDRFATFENLTDHGGGLITYHMRLALPPAAPTCNTNFDGTDYVASLDGFTPGVPLPPLSRTVGNNASGGIRGTDVCSAGTVASISAFMTASLTAVGYTLVASDSRCFYQAQCWASTTSAVSWDVTDPTDWHIVYRAPVG